MKGTEKIIAHIESDAQTKADEIISGVQKECDAIKAKYDSEAAAVYEAAVTAAQAEAENLLDSAKRMNEMEAKRSVLEVKQQQVGEAFDKALTAIPALPGEAYLKLLVNLTMEAMTTGTEELILNEQDAAAYGSEIISRVNRVKASHLTLSGDRHSCAGGVILRQDKTRVNATLELLLELARRDMSPEVAAVLFK